jgi:hypothetical protein
VTGLQRLRQLHEVLHSGQGDLTFLIKEKYIFFTLVLYLSIKGKENRMYYIETKSFISTRLYVFFL